MIAVIIEAHAGGRRLGRAHRDQQLELQRLLDLRDGGELEAVGNVLDKEFEIRSGGTALAQISRSWFRMRDTYGVDVAPDQDDALILTVAVCLDRIHHEEEERRPR